MTTTAEQIRAYDGPAILSYGFRSLFFGAAFWAVIARALWLACLAGQSALPTAFAPIEWHGRELNYGYIPAVVAGYLLTAVPNWTGRLPVVGRLLSKTRVISNKALACRALFGRLVWPVSVSSAALSALRSRKIQVTCWGEK